MEQYDVIVIGAGISGLTAASLLAKRGRKVVEASSEPGGSCGGLLEYTSDDGKHN